MAYLLEQKGDHKSNSNETEDEASAQAKECARPQNIAIYEEYSGDDYHSEYYYTDDEASEDLACEDNNRTKQNQSKTERDQETSNLAGERDQN